jgi:hypothetical protein
MQHHYVWFHLRGKTKRNWRKLLNEEVQTCCSSSGIFGVTEWRYTAWHWRWRHYAPLKVGVRNQRYGLAYQKNWIFNVASKEISSLARRLTAELGTCEGYVMDAEFWSETVNARRYSDSRHMCQNGKEILKPVLKMECLSVDSSGSWQVQRLGFLNPDDVRPLL